jgi:membrane protease YdiL (CAAX protease family)
MDPVWPRGWLLPALLANRTRLGATLVIGVVWGLWHMPLLLSSALTTVMFLAGEAGLCVLFTWLWARRGERLFAIVVAHAAVNTPMFFWEQAGVRGGPASGEMLPVWYMQEAFYAVAGLILVLTRLNWWRAMHCPDAGTSAGR